MSAKTTLVSLPLEILQQVVYCINALHRPSLFAFNQTSKSCHRAAAFLVFQRLGVTIQDPEKLRRDADQLAQVLSLKDAARHVQSLTIRGALLLEGKKTQYYDRNQSWLIRSGLAEILDDEDPEEWHRHYVVYDEGVIKECSEEDMAWTPLVSLIHAITHLKDLVYDCESQLPPSLLSMLHEKHPSCRLHHLTFRFRTLLWGVPYPYEMKLATSPLLYKVKVRCSWSDSDQDSEADFDYNSEAAKELAAGLAPNLKEVIIMTISPYLRSKYRRYPKPPWQGLPGFTGGMVGSLTSLTITAPRELRTWKNYTDLTSLRHLKLGGSKEHASPGISVGTMDWFVQNHSLPHLKALDVSLTRDDVFEERPHYSEHVISFLHCINSLEQLFLRGPLDSQIVDAALTYHGETLKKLELNPIEDTQVIGNGRDQQKLPMEITPDHIIQIQAHCPVLEELHIRVTRKKSSASETEVYRSFSGIKNLRVLFLILDCTNYRIGRDPSYNPQFEGEDQEPLDKKFEVVFKLGNFREDLINGAVDKALASSIWSIISQSKKGRKLESLKLWTQDTYHLRGISQYLCRSWLIERDPREGQERFTVKELREKARKLEERERRDGLMCCAYESKKRMFSSIWHSEAKSKEWPDNWSSFPLQI